MRADGVAANKAAATSASAAATSMDIAVHNGETFAAGDTIVVSDAGGVYYSELNPPSSGSNGNQIVYSADGSPVLDCADIFTGWTQGVEETGGVFASGLEDEVDAFTTDFDSKTVDGGNTLLVTQSPVNNGADAAAATLDGSNLGAYATVTIGEEADTYARVYFRVNSTYSNDVAYSWLPFLVLEDASTRPVMHVSIRSGSNSAYRGFYCEFANSAGAKTAIYSSGEVDEIADDTWYCVEVRYLVDGSVGGGQIWIDNVSKGSDFTKDTSGQSVDTVRVGPNGDSGFEWATTPVAGSVLYFDDVKVDTSAVGLVSGLDAANVYRKTGVTTEPIKVWFDGSLGNLETGTVDLDTNNDWYWAANILYIYSSTDPSGKTIEAGQRGSAVAAYDKNYVTLSGLRLEHSNGTFVGLVRLDGQVTGADGWELNSLVFAETGQTCIAAFATDDLTIQDCTATGDGALLSSDFLVLNKGTGATCTTILMDGCTVSGMKWGVRSPIGTDQFDGLTVSDCSFSTMGTAAMSLNDGTDILIERCTTNETGIDEDEAAFHITDCPVFVIRYNFITGQRDSGAVGGSGIQADTGSDNGEIYYNLVVDCDGPGISVIDATDIDIYNNTLYLNSQVNAAGEIYLGEALDLTANINIKNNTVFAGGDVAIEVTANVSDNAGIVIDYNCWWKAAGDWWSWGASNGDTVSGWRTESSLGAADLNEDPLFANPGGTTAVDYILQEGSPCINAGVAVGLLIDYFGTTVPQGSAPEIGFYELPSSGGGSTYAITGIINITEIT